MKEKSWFDYSADDAVLHATNNNKNSIESQHLEVLVGLIISKDYDIQQVTMAGFVIYRW